MTADGDAPREIYIILDPQCVRFASVEVAVLLAERLRASISARLVSNQLLRQVAQLPFTTEILAASGRERDLGWESLDTLQQKKAYLLQQLLEQRAQPRQVAFRIENTSESVSLQMELGNRRNLFLPALRGAQRESSGRPRSSPLGTVKWVYDNCEASERGFGLLLDLVTAGLTRRVFVFGNKGTPRRLLSALSQAGARVYWVNAASEAELLLKLQAGTDVDLLLLPASFSNSLGEARLQELNRRCVAPILVVG